MPARHSFRTPASGSSGEAVKREIAITSIPGASAVLAALVVGGLPTSRFFFEGFLPPKSAARRQRIAELATIPGTLVFFESPRRVAGLLEDLAAVLGSRDAAIARELTKMFEAVRRGTLPALADELATGEPLRGEIVVLVGPPKEGDVLLDGVALDTRIQTALETLSRERRRRRRRGRDGPTAPQDLCARRRARRRR